MKENTWGCGRSSLLNGRLAIFEIVKSRSIIWCDMED